MKTVHFLGSLTLGCALLQSALAQTSPPEKPALVGISKADAHRLVVIAEANLAEVAAGSIAVGKTANPEVKKFAQRMIDDHSKGLDATQKVALLKKVTLPTEPDSAHQKMAADLEKLSGPGFDKVYVSKAGVVDHGEVHAKLKEYMTKAQDPDVRALAEKLEPTVAHHAEMAKKLNATLK